MEYEGGFQAEVASDWLSELPEFQGLKPELQDRVRKVVEGRKENAFEALGSINALKNISEKPEMFANEPPEYIEACVAALTKHIAKSLYEEQGIRLSQDTLAALEKDFENQLAN